MISIQYSWEVNRRGEQVSVYYFSYSASMENCNGLKMYVDCALSSISSVQLGWAKLRTLFSYSEWDPKAIADTLNYLLPSKAMLCISSKTLANKCKTTEPWFKTKYNVEPVDPAWESEFSKIGTKTSQIPKELHLPPPNVLIATDFALLPAPSVEPTAPALIDQQLTHAVWHQPDATFRTPRCNVYTKFVSPKIFESPEATVLYDLFISVLTMNLKEYAYAARLAELDYTFWAQRGGFCLRVHGFNEKLPTLLSIILKMIKEFDVDSQKLKMAQQQLVRKLQNNKLSPTNVARGLRLQLLDRKQWDEAELAKLVPQMTVEQLHSYVAVLPKGIYAKMLVHGNLSVRSVYDEEATHPAWMCVCVPVT